MSPTVPAKPLFSARKRLAFATSSSGEKATSALLSARFAASSTKCFSAQAFASAGKSSRPAGSECRAVAPRARAMGQAKGAPYAEQRSRVR
eukprot:CAMPEP_0180780270 /NCGR_PEP_ID=MMETSP1038_2-20121128/46908_1 /TAXON_ID=632150 /ORGANISM="Azadinium spinosum, Strain 3D9" /LENGTH=90 /DNA_ID=CAMNT_0022815775 /DNA_START=545 /DNA_END=814 /DNA_ORIENTATION=-